MPETAVKGVISNRDIYPLNISWASSLCHIFERALLSAQLPICRKPCAVLAQTLTHRAHIRPLDSAVTGGQDARCDPTLPFGRRRREEEGERKKKGERFRERERERERETQRERERERVRERERGKEREGEWRTKRER